MRQSIIDKVMLSTKMDKDNGHVKLSARVLPDDEIKEIARITYLRKFCRKYLIQGMCRALDRCMEEKSDSDFGAHLQGYNTDVAFKDISMEDIVLATAHILAEQIHGLDGAVKRELLIDELVRCISEGVRGCEGIEERFKELL